MAHFSNNKKTTRINIAACCPFSVKKENVIDTFHIKPDNKYLLHYWRKHPNLHGWFENLYYSKGGKVEPFDCQYLNLSLADLNLLEKDIKNFNLPETTGFFFGKDEEHSTNELNEDDLDDLEFIEKARKAIENGEYVYYYSWW